MSNPPRPPTHTKGQLTFLFYSIPTVASLTPNRLTLQQVLY